MGLTVAGKRGHASHPLTPKQDDAGRYLRILQYPMPVVEKIRLLAGVGGGHPVRFGIQLEPKHPLQITLCHRPKT